MTLVLTDPKSQKWEWFCEGRDKIKEEIRLSPKASLSREFWRLTPYQEKGAPTMQVSYNGFTGELYKLERRSMFTEAAVYDLEIFNVEKKYNMQFFGVNLEDIKFLGVAVSFG